MRYNDWHAHRRTGCPRPSGRWRLRLQSGDGVELLDRRRAQAGERPEHRPLDLGDLGVLHSVHERVLGLRRVVLELLRRVLLPKRSNLVEVHLEIVGHLLGQVVLWAAGLPGEDGVGQEGGGGEGERALPDGGHGYDVSGEGAGDGAARVSRWSKRAEAR